MNFWSSQHLQQVTGGTWRTAPPAPAAHLAELPDGSPRLTTDTRALQPGQIFLAIRGERFNANTLVADAAAKGASMAIIDDPDALPPGLSADFPLLQVADARHALGQLAASYRATVLAGASVIAVCGSNGKTTTVRLIDAVLSQQLRGRASAKSFNNDIGVPLTILSARQGDQYLICEIGTNAPGEIASLGAIVRPDIAVITSIGREHLERLGSLAGVAREEASILEFLSPPPAMHPHSRRGPVAIVNADAPCLADAIAALRPPPPVTIGFGTRDTADLRIAVIAQSAAGLSFEAWQANAAASFSLPLLGAHNAGNAAAAIAVGRTLGLNDAAIAAGLRAARGPEMRLQPHDIRGITIINDAYNANPDSMRAAIATIAQLAHAAERRVLVLGDMLEMGEHSAEGHREVVAAAAALPRLDLLLLVGNAMRAAAESLGLLARTEVVLMADLDDGRDREAADLLRPGDCVLLKGSRRMRLERILAAATQEPVLSGKLNG
jgi:UDP-N-acetylmuramoyl-tripeptide--D-alanyl-D-alanine ligase